jgi:hypothetical protein
LPGPEAQQLATYIGWLMHRTLGGIIAGGLFVVPGIIAIMALSVVYAAYGNVPHSARRVAHRMPWLRRGRPNCRRQRHWSHCVEESSVADVCLFVDLPGENQCGSLIEMGSALASGRRVFLVSDNWWSIQNHPNVRKFRRLEDAIAALMAMHVGERREEAERAKVGLA